MSAWTRSTKQEFPSCCRPLVSTELAAPLTRYLRRGGFLCARAGTGLGDTEKKVGDFCAKLTFGTTTLTLINTVVTATAMGRLPQLKGSTVGFGAWVKSAVGSQCRLKVDDGVTVSYSSYHTGDGTWQWLSSTHAISATGTKLDVGIAVESSAANPAYLSGYTVILGNLAPTGYRPAITLNSTIGWTSTGAQSAGTGKGWYMFNRPAIVRYIQAELRTAPTGATTFKIDVNRGGTTMLGSVIAFTASDKCAAKAPDGTYSQYCFPGTNVVSGVTITDELTYDIDAERGTDYNKRFLAYLAYVQENNLDGVNIDDEQILAAVAIGVEESRIDIFRQAVSGDGRLLTRPKRSISLLNEKLATLPLGTANIDIVESVAIHVSNRQRWPFSREELRHQRLASEVEERILPMLEFDSELTSNVGKDPGL